MRDFRMSSSGSDSTNELDVRPAVVTWEVVRASAGDLHEPTWKGLAGDRELDLLEGRRLLDAFAEATPARMILRCPGGALRADLPDLVRHAATRPPGAVVELAGRPHLDEVTLDALADAGVRCVALGLDEADAEGARDVLAAVAQRSIPLEIVTRVGEENLADIRLLARRVERLGAVRWRIEFPVRAESWLPTTEQADRAIEALLEVEKSAAFALEIAALPHVVRRRAEIARQRGEAPVELGPPVVGDGRGTLFVSWCGDIYPSAQLPLPCGNVRLQDVIAVYRFHPVFRMLRDPDSLEDRCGRCEYRRRCGGSRARAFAVKGHVLASDPLCSYQPRAPRTSFP